MTFYIFGYSGHSFVVIESALSNNFKVLGYYENEEKNNNPYSLQYLGPDEILKNKTDAGNIPFFIGIGENAIREKIFETFDKRLSFTNIIDKSANVSFTAQLKEGIYIGKNACVNALSKIGNGTIINTGAIVEHECTVGDFTHVAPGVVLCGNVSIGKRTFIGANTVIKPGIIIGDNVTIGVGSVVTKNISNNTIVYGNPAKKPS